MTDTTTNMTSEEQRLLAYSRRPWRLTIAAATILAAVGTGLVLSATPAHADTSWVADDSAMICNQLYLEHSMPGQNWATLTISELQMKHDASRSEVVAGMYQAAVSYCPQYVSAVPAR